MGMCCHARFNNVLFSTTCSQFKFLFQGNQRRVTVFCSYRAIRYSLSGMTLCLNFARERNGVQSTKILLARSRELILFDRQSEVKLFP